jgi:hypothetical protein
MERHPERERRTWAEGRHENEATDKSLRSATHPPDSSLTLGMTFSRGVSLFLIATTLVLTLPATSFACTTCFGDPNSSMAKGAANGVWFMIGIIAFVQIGFIALFYSFWRRAKAMRRLRDQFHVLEGGAR